MSNLGQFTETVFNILGGLAIFLFAMKHLAINLQNIVGGKIEQVLRKLTNRPYKGMFVGTFVTFITQSSSITVLTLIGLVNVGALSLYRGVGILLGAEIGTTITAQLVTLKIGLYYFPLIVFGLAMSTSRRKALASLGKVIFSFGLLFMGMDLMKTGAIPLKQSPAISSLFEQFATNPLFGIAMGAVFTAITSSSSATTSLVVAMGASGAINLPAAIALILGANIGTTFLELVAVVNMGLTAKRVAVAQALINVVGVIIILPFVGPLAALAASTSSGLDHQIANSHTIFNVGSSLIFLFFTGAIVKTTKKLVPGKIVRVGRGTRHLDKHILGLPHVATLNCVKETKRMGKAVSKMFDCIEKVLKNGSGDLLEILYSCEKHVDHLHKEIASHIAMIYDYDINQETLRRLTQLLHGNTDIERAADHLNKVTSQLEQVNKKKIAYNQKDRNQLLKYAAMCKEIYDLALKSFLEDNPKLASKVPEMLRKVETKKKRMNSKLTNLRSQKNKTYSLIVHHLERAAHHGENLADIVMSGV